MALATVLIPTFDHGPLLRYSIQTVQQQTVDDLEIFVVGDGVPDVTRELVAELQEADPRIRFFDHPKGPRHGEAYRDPIIREHASGEIICGLSDDDLWLPRHVEIMHALLQDADFAHCQGASIDPEGNLGLWALDMTRPWYRQRLATDAGLPHSFVAYTKEFYLRMPEGWATTPEGIPTDRNMWLKMLRVPGLRVAAGITPTAVLLASPQRRHMSLEEREAELTVWATRVAEPAWIEELHAQVRRFHFDNHVGLKETLTRIQESPAWRLRDKLLALPGVSTCLRTAARVLAGRGAR